MSIFGCASDEQFLGELDDIESRYDSLDDVREATSKLISKYEDND